MPGQDYGYRLDPARSPTQRGSIADPHLRKEHAAGSYQRSSHWDVVRQRTKPRRLNT